MTGQMLEPRVFSSTMPVSKALLQVVPPTMIAAFLYIRAGIGVGTKWEFFCLSVFTFRFSLGHINV